MGVRVHPGPRDRDELPARRPRQHLPRARGRRSRPRAVPRDRVPLPGDARVPRPARRATGASSCIKTTPTLGPERQAKEIHPELYKVDPDQCCYLNKVLPMESALEDLGGWATGVRRDQSPTRVEHEDLRDPGAHVRQGDLEGQPAGALDARAGRGVLASAQPAVAPAVRRRATCRSAARRARVRSPVTTRTSAPAAGTASTRPSAASTRTATATATRRRCRSGCSATRLG